MEVMSTVATQVLSSSKPLLLDFVNKAKTNFIARFGEYVQSAHLSTLEDIFLQAGVARIEILFVKTAAEAQEWEETYQTNLLRLKTLGLEIYTIGKTDTRQFLRDEIDVALSYVPVVAGIVVKVALPIAFPGVGSLVGPIAGAGVEFVLDKLMGVPTK